MIPTPNAHQQSAIDRFVGLPYVCIDSPGAPPHRVVGQLSNGTKVRAHQVEDLWNAALLIEAIEGSGAAKRAGDDAAGRLHAELIALAERLFGATVTEALPVYMAMRKYSYGRWEERPRVAWPRVAVN